MNITDEDNRDNPYGRRADAPWGGKGRRWVRVAPVGLA